jgi:hypothetical protein
MRAQEEILYTSEADGTEDLHPGSWNGIRLHLVVQRAQDEILYTSTATLCSWSSTPREPGSEPVYAWGGSRNDNWSNLNLTWIIILAQLKLRVHNSVVKRISNDKISNSLQMKQNKPKSLQLQFTTSCCDIFPIIIKPVKNISCTAEKL